MRASKAFTLAELLIALYILGVIATFTIPKVLNAVKIDKRNAVYRESIGSFTNAFHTGIMTQELTETNFSSYFFEHLNTLKQCSNSAGQGCWNTGTHCPNWSNGFPGLILHNGTHITQLDDADQGGGWDAFMMDWNGDAGPNTEGNDIICLGANFYTNANGRAGTIVPWPGRPLSISLFEAIFSTP